MGMGREVVVVATGVGVLMGGCFQDGVEVLTDNHASRDAAAAELLDLAIDIS